MPAKRQKVVQHIGHIAISLSNSGTYLNIYDDKRKGTKTEKQTYETYVYQNRGR